MGAWRVASRLAPCWVGFLGCRSAEPLGMGVPRGGTGVSRGRGSPVSSLWACTALSVLPILTRRHLDRDGDGSDATDPWGAVSYRRPLRAAAKPWSVCGQWNSRNARNHGTHCEHFRRSEPCRPGIGLLRRVSAVRIDAGASGSGSGQGDDAVVPSSSASSRVVSSLLPSSPASSCLRRDGHAVGHRAATGRVVTCSRGRALLRTRRGLCRRRRGGCGGTSGWS